MIETKALIQANGLKATPQRIAVYLTLKELGHASADMVYDRVISNYPTLTVATVYNILESFVDKGLINRLSSSNVKMYFDINTYPHCHLYSDTTHHYVDFDDQELIDIVNDHFKKRNIKGFIPSGVEVHIKGKFTE